MHAAVPKSANGNTIPYGKNHASGVDKIVRMENLHSDLSELGLDMNQELTLNTGDYLDKWSDIKTPELIEVINLWAGKAFDLYGYERL